MGWNQLKDANMNTSYTGGWCLKFVQDAFGTDHIYPRAIDEWDATGEYNHTDVPPLGITVPVFFSLGNVPAGHVAIRTSDGWVASSTQPGVHPAPYYHKSLDDLIAVYGKYNGGCTYLGWSEVVGSERVVEFVPDVVNATDEQIQQAYQDLLGRPADADGLAHYLNYSIDFVRTDLQDSQEYANRQAKLAAEAAQPAPNPVVAPIHNPDPTPEPPVSPVETTPSPSPAPAPVTEPPVQSEPVSTPVALPDPLPSIDLPAEPAPAPRGFVIRFLVALLNFILRRKP